MFFDIHTHAFHPKIAHKAVEHLDSFYRVACVGDGTVGHLLQREKAAGIDRCVILCAATTPAQVVPANNYAMRLQNEHEEVIAFGTVHPGYDRWEAELARMKAAGLVGIKLHPEFQSFRLDDPRLLPVFEAAQEDFILEIHIGDNVPPEQNPSCPYKLAAILDAFPRLTVIAAHLGGYRMWEHALRVLGGRRRENLWFDTSSVTPFVSEEELRGLLAAFPRERLLFGTDWPLYDPCEEMERLQRMAGMTDEQLETIMGNAGRLFSDAARDACQPSLTRLKEISEDVA